MHLPSLTCVVFSGVTFTVVSSFALQPNKLRAAPEEQSPTAPRACVDDVSGLNAAVAPQSGWTCTYYLKNLGRCGETTTNGVVPQDYCCASCKAPTTQAPTASPTTDAPTGVPTSAPFDACANPTIYCGDTVITEGQCAFGTDVYVKTPQLQYGINQHGALGSEECPATGLGFHANSCGNGAGLGIVSSNGEPSFGENYSGDFFIPGVPYEGWQFRLRNKSKVMVDMEGSLKDSSEHGTGTLTVKGNSVRYDVSKYSGFDLSITYTPSPNCTGIGMYISVTPTKVFDPALSVYFARSMVPDPGEPWGENLGTYQHVVSASKQSPPRNEKYAIVSATTKKARGVSLISCDPRARAGIGGYGFLYDLPTYYAMNMTEKKAYDADQDIWMVWKDSVPKMGEAFEFSAAWLTRSVEKSELDYFFCNPPPGLSEPTTEAPTEAEPLATKAPPSASGDPHLVNIRGQKFDIYKVGQLEFLRVPYQSKKEQANFTALATVKDVAGQTSECKQSRYITSMLFGGAWVGDHQLEVYMDRGRMNVLLGGERVKPSLKPLLIGGGGMVKAHMIDQTRLHVEIGKARVIVSRDIQPVHFFLNVQASSLKMLGYRIGGLLGEDPHAAVSTPPAECRNHLSLMAAPDSTLRSVASASL